MYVYLYDKWTKEPQYESLLTSIETRLIEFGMNGKVEKLAVYKDTDRILEPYTKKGAHTVVAVGDDSTLRAAIQAVWDHDITLGYIPLKKTAWSESLRIPAGVEACETLSKRLCKPLSVGRAKTVSVLEDVTFVATEDAWIRCDDQYTIAFKEGSVCRIVNQGAFDHNSENTGNTFRIEITQQRTPRFRKPKHTQSIFFAESCMVGTSTNHIPLMVDSTHEIQSPCEITLYPNHVSMIVGKSL